MFYYYLHQRPHLVGFKPVEEEDYMFYYWLLVLLEQML